MNTQFPLFLLTAVAAAQAGHAVPVALQSCSVPGVERSARCGVIEVLENPDRPGFRKLELRWRYTCLVHRARSLRLPEPCRSDHAQSRPHRMGPLRRNAIPAFPESRLWSGARSLRMRTPFTSAVQDRIAHGGRAVGWHLNSGGVDPEVNPSGPPVWPSKSRRASRHKSRVGRSLTCPKVFIF